MSYTPPPPNAVDFLLFSPYTPPPPNEVNFILGVEATWFYRGDSGTGTDVATLASTFTRTDSGAGQDSLPSVAAALFGSEQGSGQEALSSGASFLRTDTGSGLEQLLALLGTLLRTDSGSGTDAAQMHVSLVFPDAGIGEDVSQLVAIFPLSDAGTATELVTARDLFTTDHAVGTELISLLSGFLLALDDGTATDLSSLVASSIQSDTGTGTDDFPSLEANIPRSDTATGTDTLTTFRRDLGPIESGAGTDLASIICYFLGNDAAVGIDGSSLAAYVIAISDAATAADTATLVASHGSSDSGEATEDSKVINFYLIRDDAGDGTDAVVLKRSAVIDAGIAAELSSLLSSLSRTDSGKGKDRKQMLFVFAPGSAFGRGQFKPAFNTRQNVKPPMGTTDQDAPLQADFIVKKPIVTEE